LAFYFTVMHFLGKNLRYLRKQSSKTQSEIASLIQKGQTTIGNWENGISEPSLSELLIISNYFDIPLDTLIKMDLADTQAYGAPRPGSHPVNVRPYDHSEIELSVVKEQEDKLSFVLQEIRSIRSDIEQLYTRLP
jgi:transcriptional regulator with XRE-family HTH domain